MSDQWHVTKSLFPQLVSRLSIDCPQNTRRFSHNKTQTPPHPPQNPVNEKTQLSVFSAFGVVSFELNPASIKGVAFCAGTLPGQVFTDGTYPEFTVYHGWTSVNSGATRKPSRVNTVLSLPLSSSTADRRTSKWNGPQREKVAHFCQVLTVYSPYGNYRKGRFLFLFGYVSTFMNWESWNAWSLLFLPNLPPLNIRTTHISLALM